MDQRRSVTRNLNVARYLLGVFQDRGEVCFCEQLAKLLTRQSRRGEANTGEVEREVRDLVACILALLYPREPEAVLRHQAAILDPFLAEPSPDLRNQRLVDSLSGFLADHFAREPADSLSCQVQRWLKAASDEELRRLTVDILAEHFQYNRNYLADKYRHETGLTLQEALVREKMNRAFQLFTRRDETLTVKEVADRLGFSDVPYFRKLFQRRYGYLPSDIR